MDGTTSGGMPMGGGGMPMGGMPMMGGGMGGNSNGERTREVYDDEDIVASDGSLGRRGGRRGSRYEEEISPASRRTPTSSGYDPVTGEEHQQTQSAERERESWVPEEEDVWGTDEGGAPAVIG
jgi:hypothetical protein